MWPFHSKDLSANGAESKPPCIPNLTCRFALCMDTNYLPKILVSYALNPQNVPDAQASTFFLWNAMIRDICCGAPKEDNVFYNRIREEGLMIKVILLSLTKTIMCLNRIAYIPSGRQTALTFPFVFKACSVIWVD